MPTVSVIVPNFNHAPYLHQRIDSILAQSYQDFELILLDDCSMDNSRDIILSYKENPRVTHIEFNEQNSGTTFKQWEKGIELASGNYIWIAESDDWAETDFLKKVVNEFEKLPNVGLIYTASRLIDAEGNITYKNPQPDELEKIEYTGKTFISSKLSSSNSIWNASMMMFRKSLFPNHIQRQLFVNMKYCGDWFFYVLIAENTNVLEIKQTLNNFRVHSKNVSSAAEMSGATFLEGLDIYQYIKGYLTISERLNTAFIWAKQLSKSKRRFQFSKQTRRQILKKMYGNFFDILLCYYLYEFTRIFKNKQA